MIPNPRWPEEEPEYFEDAPCPLFEFLLRKKEDVKDEKASASAAVFRDKGGARSPSPAASEDENVETLGTSSKTNVTASKARESADGKAEDTAHSGKVYRVPNDIKYTGSKDFFVHYDSTRKLWIGMEYLTEANIDWWKRRLGWDAHMQWGKQMEEQFLREMAMSQQERDSQSEAAQQYINALHGGSRNAPPVLPEFYEERLIVDMRIGGVSDFYTEPASFLEVFLRYTPPSHLNHSYLGAFRGFKKNLKHYKNLPTWVAYVSSQRPNGPLYEDEGFTVTSPALKMAMTVIMGGPFYNPLGIYSSPIARASDPEPYTRLAMPLHSAVARMMGELDPEIKYMVVRPLQSMQTIFEKSGVPFSATKGSKPSESLPAILRKGAQGNDNVQFDGHPYVLFDPRTDETHQIGLGHGFSKNRYMGGITLEEMDLPFVTTDREALENLKKR